MLKSLVIAALTLLSVALGTVGAELYFRHVAATDREWVAAPIYRPDPELGYSGIPGSEGLDYLKVNGEYHVRAYLKLDRNGFREVTGSESARGPRCLVILGDSAAFGIGVEAERTFASLLQARLRNTRVFNFAFAGYGPHQSLRFLELGRERELLRGCREVKSYYFGIEDNYWRALGRAPWGLTSPRYVLAKGKLTCEGPFHPEWMEVWNSRLRKYHLHYRLASWALGYGKETSSGETDLYRRFFLSMKDILLARYGSDFRVIYFTQGKDPRHPSLRKLEGEGVPVSYAEDFALARGTPIGLAKQALYLADGTHPNEVGHKLVADALAGGELRGWLR